MPRLSKKPHLTSSLPFLRVSIHTLSIDRNLAIRCLVCIRMPCFVAETLLPGELKVPIFVYSGEMIVFQAFPPYISPVSAQKSGKLDKFSAHFSMFWKSMNIHQYKFCHQAKMGFFRILSILFFSKCLFVKNSNLFEGERLLQSIYSVITNSFFNEILEEGFLIFAFNTGL